MNELDGSPRYTMLDDEATLTEEQWKAGAEAGRRLKELAAKGPRLLRCYSCDAPAGQSTLQRVDAIGSTLYVCKDGDCAGQRAKYLTRVLAKVTPRGKRKRR